LAVRGNFSASVAAPTVPNVPRSVFKLAPAQSFLSTGAATVLDVLCAHGNDYSTLVGDRQAPPQSFISMPSPQVIPPNSTPEIQGVFPTDIILRSAIMLGLAEVRAPENRWLLETCFTSQTLDVPTQNQYGVKEQNRAIEWFLNTEVPVFFGQINVNDFKIPSITLELMESAEDTNTLADIHYVPWQDTPSPITPQIFGTFTPLSYVQATGTVTLMPSQANLPVFPGMIVVQTDGTQWEVQQVLLPNQFTITPGSPAQLNNSTLQANEAQTPSWTILAESAIFKETYRIGVHVNSEPAHLTYLHDIVKMVLLRGRQKLLEFRGIERTTISSSDFAKNFQLEGEVAFSRFITMSGYVRTSWPADRNLRSQGLTVTTTQEESEVAGETDDGVAYQNT